MKRTDRREGAIPRTFKRFPRHVGTPMAQRSCSILSFVSFDISRVATLRCQIMRLKPEEISAIVRRLADTWTRSPHVEVMVDLARLIPELEALLVKPLQDEDVLDAEVEKLLTQYEKEFARGTLDRRKMFQMAKTQLAKEKGVVL